MEMDAAFEARFQEVKQEIAQKSATDSDFREALLANPASAIEEEYGLESGALAEVNIQVVEEAGGIVIPIPQDLSEMELTDEQLDQVAGGAFFTIAAAITAATAAAKFTAAAGALAIGAGTIVQNSRAGRGW